MQKAGAQAGMGVKLPLEAFGEAIQKTDFCLQKSVLSQKAESEQFATHGRGSPCFLKFHDNV